MSDIIIEKVNESCVKIECEEDISHDIYGYFSAFVSGYQFQPRYKLHVWDGKIHVYSPSTHLLPIGLMGRLMKLLDEKGEEYRLEGFGQLMDDGVEEWLDDEIKINMENCKYGIRDYQRDAVKRALEHKRGILLSCTSSGKSLMIYNILRILQRRKGLKKQLLVVPSKMLVEQMYSDFKEYGWKELEDNVSMLYGEKKKDCDFHKPILITTWQSIMKQPKTFFVNYDSIIVDESHQSSAQQLGKILKECICARYKIGTTGTLPTDNADMLQITGGLGDVIFELRSKDLIDRGLLTKITIANIVCKYPMDFIKTHKNLEYPEEVRTVEEYPTRNTALNMILDHTDKKHNMLLLVNHNEHLDQLKLYLESHYPDRKISIINGSVKASKREEIRTEIENEDGTIILATFGTMSTGVNIPKLHEVILYSNSKSKIKVLQSIGRGLRKHNSKSQVILYDIIDDMSYYTPRGKLKKNYLMIHWDERVKYYREQEFPMITTTINL